MTIVPTIYGEFAQHQDDDDPKGLYSQMRGKAKTTLWTDYELISVDSKTSINSGFSISVYEIGLSDQEI